MSSPLVLDVASAADREAIYRVRHEIYAAELGQHAVHRSGRLTDALDDANLFLVARAGAELAGFVSITPPTAGSYSIDKYFERDGLPFPVDDRLHEVRLLTIRRAHRGRNLALLLMYAALRWVESHGGRHVVAIGRRDVLDLYLRVGLERMGRHVRSGAVTYDLLHASVAELRGRAARFTGLLERLERRTEWRLSFPFRRPAACFHGGAFFGAIGERFDHLERRHTVINADVLDAWFDPAPGVRTALERHLPWLLRTSPPANCEGLIRTIADARGVEPENILPGAGSSDLIFRALRHWLTPSSRTLILDPTYGEYSHVLERVIGATVDRLPLPRESEYAVDLKQLQVVLARGYELVVLVNPNSPTGRHIRRQTLETVLGRIPRRTRVWVDEAYVEYAGPEQSMETFAARSENVLVCKSMSKVYALSGARVAYLCGGAHQLDALRALTPPWVVSLPAQLAAVRALQDPAYYAKRYAQTAVLREALTSELRALGWRVLPGVANFLLCELPADGPTAAELVSRCRAEGLFLRDAATMGSCLGERMVRVAVKDPQTSRRMVRILRAIRSG